MSAIIWTSFIKFLVFILNIAYRLALYCCVEYIYQPHAKCEIRNKRGKNVFSGWNYYITPFDPSNISMLIQWACIQHHSTLSPSLFHTFKRIPHTQQSILKWATTSYFNSTQSKLLNESLNFVRIPFPIWPFILDIESLGILFISIFISIHRCSCHSRWESPIFSSIHLTQK